MEQLATFIAVFASDESGVTAIEYALLGALISAAIVTGVGLLGGQVAALYNRVASVVSTALN